MEGDRAPPVPRVFGSDRANIPRPTPGKAVSPASATVQAARNLKRRSTGHFIKALSVTPVKKMALSTQATSRYSDRQSASMSRESAEENKTESESRKSQLTLKDQNPEEIQTSSKNLQDIIASNDTRLNTIQMALDSKKGESSMHQLQVALDAKNSENAHLMKDISRLTSQLAAKCDELREKDENIRLLHNTVVDLKGQIRVAVRVRPPLGKERDVPMSRLSYPGVSSIRLDLGRKSLSFEFQRVFGPNTSQACVFKDVEELIMSCLHGYNVSIIAYGQTGSGKTHTMRGGEGESEGIIPRAVKFLLQSRDKLADLDWKFEFKVSFIEVYNEEVYDLLGERKKLGVKMGSGNTSVTGPKYNEINAIDDIENFLAVTDITQSTAATECNEQSSRGHAVVELSIQGYNKTSGASRHACLHLVDLAGSELVKESGAEGDRFYIDSALSNLQQCILSQLNKNPHIPYRNSELTMILRDSLGAGNSKTMVIVTLNPTVSQIAETIRSLRFASQMSMTRNGQQ